METFLIKFRVWIDNKLSVAEVKILANSEKEAEEKFVLERHVLPLKIEKC